MRLFIALLLLTVSSVFADMVVLKNGQVLIGSYLSEDDRKIKFQVFNEVKTITKSDISSFELGYSGVPVCYQLQSKWSQTCGDVIHLLDKNKMVLGKGKGLLEKEELQLKDLKKITRNEINNPSFVKAYQMLCRFFIHSNLKYPLV